MDAAARLIECFPAAAETDKFFADHAEALIRLGKGAIEILDVPANAAILYATTRMLTARLGPEASALVDFVRMDCSLARRMSQALDSAENELIEVGQMEWLKSRKVETVKIQDDIWGILAGKALTRSSTDFAIPQALPEH